ncbi:BQ2448_7656 [Microbotryum intermedium]|uniref:BQ2448_7656 protein n=1 Tax=Microbotryum intermedium TaxID=269621 RepID=A0A238FMW1_9BASI|nr:BQ2448_7656 [Microbotryum intermedium]
MATTMPGSPHENNRCLKGVLHAGTPKGSMTTVDGVDVYVSLPAAGKYDETLAVLYLGDIFGIYDNAKLICDGFAENGYATYFPDYLNKDPVPLEEMNAGRFDLGAWVGRCFPLALSHPSGELILLFEIQSKNHTEAHTRPTLDKVIAALKKHGVTKFTCTGYCYGGKYAVALAVDNVVTCAVAAHPSGIRIPEDLDLLREKSKAPFLINACETDRTWPRDQQDKAEEMMGGGRYAPGWKQNYFPGCTHGFAVRGDITNDKIKYGKEEAFKQTVAWFNKYAK